jgi:hypothetical protein
MLENRAMDLDTKVKADTPKKAKSKPNKKHQEIGQAVIATMTPEEIAELGCKSHTLHFQHLLGLQSKKADRVGKNRQFHDCFKAVGVTLISDEPITVPVIDVRKDKNTGIEPEDITYRQVEAGVPFDLTYYEFMYLVIRREYAGFISYEGDPKGIYISAKINSYLDNQAKLPTPTINSSAPGSPKENMIAIDRKDAEGKWVIKDEYKEKFGPLLERKVITRAASNQPSVPTPTLTALALSKILGVQKDN